MNSFREIVQAFGAKELAAIIGVDESHARVMATRDSIPPKYWAALLEAEKPRGLRRLSFALLHRLYDERFPKNEPPNEIEAAQ